MLRLGAVWLRIELRRRWRPLLLLTLLVAISAGALLSSVAGARRGASATDRLLARTLPATAVVRTNQVAVNYWPQIRRLPGVAAVSTFPGYSGFGVEEAPGDPVRAYLPLDADAMRTIERPVVLAGRLADPARADEAVVTQRFVASTGRGVGSTVTVRLFSAKQTDAGVNAVRTTVVPHPDGPAVRTTIVGVVRSPWFSDDVGDRGRLIPSPGLAAAYPKSILGEALDGEQWGLVRLSDGAAGLPALRAQLSSLIPSTPGADVVPQSEAIGHWRSVTRFEAGSLLGLAAAVLVAAAFLVGTAVTRQVATTRAALQPIIPLGMTPAQVIGLSTAGPVLAGLVGSAIGLGLAVVASRWLPFGVAAGLEPTPGPDVDVMVLGPGALLVTFAAAGWALLVGWLVQQVRPASSRASRIARAAAASGLPVPVAVGLRHALEAGVGRVSVPVRSALAGAVVGVLGVVGGLTFAAAVDDASSPQRFGQRHQLVVAFGYNGLDLSCAPAAQKVVTQDPAVRSIVDLRFQTAELTGAARVADRTVTVFADRVGDGRPVLSRGRAATGPDDVVLAPTTAKRLGASLGSRVTVQGQLPGSTYGPTGKDVPVGDPCSGRAAFGVGPPAAGTTEVPGPKRTAVLTVSGIGFVPQTEYNEYDSGAWVSAATYQRLFGTGFVNHELLVGLAPGAVPGEVAARLAQGFASIPGPLFTSEPPPIERAREIGDLRALPLLLCVFLGILALAATGHVLLVSGARRRGELAVLRALGMSSRQARLVPSTQAAVYALAGLAVGIPLGVAAGRALWRVVSDQTPLAYRAPGGWPVLLIVIGITLLAVQILAVPASYRASRARIAEVLRAE